MNESLVGILRSVFIYTEALIDYSVVFATIKSHPVVFSLLTASSVDSVIYVVHIACWYLGYFAVMISEIAAHNASVQVAVV